MSSTFEPALIVAGLVLCLFGWTAYWAGLRLLGAMCGALAGGGVAFVAFLFVENDQWLFAGCAGAAVIGAVLGVLIIKRAHYFLFFVTGAVLGLAGAWTLQAQWHAWFEEHVPEGTGRLLYFAGATVVGGLLLVLAHRLVVILLTALAGTGLFLLGVPWPKYAILGPPVFVGSVLVQTGILAAFGDIGEAENEEQDE